MLNQHLRIFSRRKGIIDLDFADTINLRPVLGEIETTLSLLAQQRDKLHEEINALRHDHTEVKQTIAHEKQKCEQQQVQLEQEQEHWLQSYQDVIKTQTEISLLEQILHPIQEQLNHIRPHLEALEQSTRKFDHVFNELQSMF
jgi:chromosome segregation ATPase